MLIIISICQSTCSWIVKKEWDDEECHSLMTRSNTGTSTLTSNSERGNSLYLPNSLHLCFSISVSDLVYAAGFSSSTLKRNHYRQKPISGANRNFHKHPSFGPRSTQYTCVNSLVLSCVNWILNVVLRRKCHPLSGRWLFSIIVCIH